MKFFRFRRKRRKSQTKHHQKYREQARVLVHARLAHFNSFYHFEYKKVFIKNTKSRWGSASSRKNLNFNYRIYLLPPELQDYLIVHELCHLREFNHSPAFWELVSQTIPHYKKVRAELKKIRIWQSKEFPYIYGIRSKTRGEKWDGTHFARLWAFCSQNAKSVQRL